MIRAIRDTWTAEDRAIIARQIHRVIWWQCEPAYMDMVVYGTGQTLVNEETCAAVMRAWLDYYETGPKFGRCM